MIELTGCPSWCLGGCLSDQLHVHFGPWMESPSDYYGDPISLRLAAAEGEPTHVWVDETQVSIEDVLRLIENLSSLVRQAVTG